MSGYPMLDFLSPHSSNNHSDLMTSLSLKVAAGFSPKLIRKLGRKNGWPPTKSGNNLIKQWFVSSLVGCNLDVQVSWKFTEEFSYQSDYEL